MANYTADDVQDTQQATQPTQEYSQPFGPDGTRTNEHLWGYLQPCNNELHRIDFFKVNPRYSIGRHKDSNQVVLPGMKISNHHCLISWDGSGDNRCAIVQDLSTNGTFINGERIGKGISRTLYEGNEISFGTAIPQPVPLEDYRFSFRFTAFGPPNRGIFAQYDVTNELGRGSFATVYKALHRITGEFYALKVITETRRTGGRAEQNAQLDKNLSREVAIMQQMRHPNICKLKEVFFEANGDLGLVIELVTGGDLLDYILTRGPLPNDISQHLTYQLCDALAYIHTLGIAHRDLKPENVLLTNDVPPIVKVGDFGLAKVVTEATMLKTMCGTPAYLAPEVVRQSQQDPGYDNLVDSWSVGIIVFGMLTNQSPVIEEDTADVRKRIMTRQIDLSALQETKNFIVTPNAADFVVHLLDEYPISRMSLASALTHPWLKEYSPIYAFHDGVPTRLIPASAPNFVPNPTNSDGFSPDASMISAAGSFIQSQPLPAGVSRTSVNSVINAPPHSFPRDPSRVFQRRSDVMAMAREGQLNLPVPSEDMRYHNGLPAIDGTEHAAAANGNDNAIAGPSGLNGQPKKRRREELTPPRESDMNNDIEMQSPMKKARDSSEDDAGMASSSSSSPPALAGKTTKAAKGKTKPAALPSEAPPRRSGRNAPK